MEQKENKPKDLKQKRPRTALPLSVSIGEIIKAKEEERKEKER